MNRRTLLTGLISMGAAGIPSIASPFGMMEGSSEMDRMVQFAEVWSRLSEDQKAIHLDLLRALVALPEGACSDHLYAKAHEQLNALRQSEGHHST